MIKLIFTYNHNVIIFEINNKHIRYYDEKWKMGINFIPKDHDFVRTVIMSRNRIAAEMIRWINDANSGKNLAEWEACKDDYDVAEIVKRDAKLKGCVFRKLFTEEEIKQSNQNKQYENIPQEQPEEVAQGEEIEYETEQIITDDVQESTTEDITEVVEEEQ